MEPSPKRAKLESIPIPILHDELVQDIPLIDAYIAKIENMKNASGIIQELNKKVPIPQLQHLKRMDRDRVLLCLKTDVESDVNAYLTSKGFDHLDWISDLRVVQVAKVPPKIRKQYDRAREMWPCNFHLDSYLEKLTSGTLFTSEELGKHRRIMELWLEMSLKFDTTVALVMNPMTDAIVAFGNDSTDENPVKHSVMMAIDNVARTQLGGAWKTDGKREEMLKFLQDTEFKVTESAPTKDDYLCTNLVLYSIREPCSMCAMALVHSRIKRVFYGCRSSKGALGTLCKLHLVDGLNHHYEVFAGLLEEECERIQFGRLVAS